jgi:DNA-binding transcriptional LysR family regulator
MTNTSSATEDKRKDHKRVKGSFLDQEPPIESFRCFAEMARRLQPGNVRSLRSLSKEMGFSPSHLGKWLPPFAEQIGFHVHELVELPSPGQPIVRLTRPAASVLNEIKKLLGYYRTVVTQAGAMREQIICGTWQWLMSYVFSKAVPRFASEQLNRTERTGLAFFEYDTDTMLEDISKGVIDIGFGACEDDLREMYADRVVVYPTEIRATGELVAIAPKGHAWEAARPRTEVTASDLVKETLCVTRYDHQRRFANFRARGTGNARLVVVDNYASVLGMVSAAARQKPVGEMVGIVPRFGVQEANGTSRDPSLNVVEISGIWNPKNPLSFWVRKSWTPHPELGRFIDCTATVANEVWGGEQTSRASAKGRAGKSRRGRSR